MKFYDRFVEFLEQKGLAILGITLVLIILSAIGIRQVQITTDFNVFMPTESKQMDLVAQMGNIFGDTNQLLFLVESDGSVSDLRLLSETAREIGAIQGIRKAHSPIPESFLELTDHGFAQRLAMVEGIQNQNPLTPRAEGGFWVTLRISLDEQESIGVVLAEIEQKAESLNRDFLLSGEPYLQGKVYHYVESLLVFLPPAAILLLLLVFRFRIGSWKATLLSMVPAILGGLFTLGTISWINGSISIISVLVPVFIIVLGSADGLHVTSHVMDRLAEGRGNRDAVIETLHAVGVPIVMTSLTTMAGFLSMLLIDSPAIREMGIGAAWGIALAGAATWIVLPIFLLKLKPLKRTKNSENSRVLGLLMAIQGRPAILITLFIMVLSIPGALKLTSDFSMLSMYKRNTDVRKSIEDTTNALGGAIPVALLFETSELFDQETSRAVLAFQERARETGIAVNSVSLYQTLVGISRMYFNSDTVPDDRQIQNSLFATLDQINPEVVNTFYHPTGFGRAYFFLPNLDSQVLEEFVTIAEDISREYGVPLNPVSTVFAMKEMNDKIIVQQIYSLLLAIGLVILLSTLTHKSFKLGLLSGLPIGITLLALFGFMGFTGIELSIVSGIMTGLTVGVGIDYAIHYISMYQYSKNQAEPETNHAKKALTYVATPILANALGLAIGFTAMNLSPFRIHVILSLLMWVTMVLSAFLSLSLLPTLMGITRKS